MIVWIRADLKTRAKAVLKLSYWKAFLVSLIIGLAGAEGGGNGSSGSGWRMNGGEARNLTGFFGHTVNEGHVGFFIIAIGLIILALIFAFRIFLGYPLEVGGRRYFIQSTQKEFNMNNLGYAFVKGRYMSIVQTMLLRGIYNFLWFLLLIIPGIIKYYAYSMVPYILSDNPNIGHKRAIEISNAMTDGQKFDMWVLDLSFIGWYLLGTLLFFIGVLFVRPYEYATKAELYMVLRQNALEKGICSYEELMPEPALAEGI